MHYHSEQSINGIECPYDTSNNPVNDEYQSETHFECRCFPLVEYRLVIRQC